MKLFRNEKTVRREASRKEFLYFSLALVIFLDLFAAIMIGVSGVTDAKYIVCPALLVALDVCFLVLSLFTNYRFRYSVAGTVLYLCFSLTLLAVTAALHAGGGTVTRTAGGAWLAAHLLALAGTCAAAFGAAGQSGKYRYVSFAALGAAIAAAVLYCTTAGIGGAFGQGYAGRTVTYRYDAAADGYVAVSLVKGRGERLTIPETFNGKRVVAVDCAVFSADGLEEIYLDSAGALELTNTASLQDFKDGVTVYADKDEYDALRSAYFKDAYEQSSEALLRFACSFAPTGLEKDEVFVSFDYSMETLQRAQGEVLPVWVGKKGDVFRTDFSGVGYAAHADANSDADLLWCTRNMAGYILASPVAGETPIAGQRIEHSVTGAQLRFTRVYRVSIGDDNDAVYETPAGYRQTAVEGETLPYKLATADTCDRIIEEFPAREGFSLSFRTAGATLSGKLSDVLKNGDADSVVIYPVWQLLPPVLSPVEVSGGNRAVVYGTPETKLSWTAETPEGFACDYSLTVPDGSALSVGSEYTVNNFAPDHAGTYTVTATMSAPQITSLTAEASASIALEFVKKELSFGWNALASSVYDGTRKEVTARVTDGVVNNDEITFALSPSGFTDAGDHTVSLTLTGECSGKYVPSAQSRSHVYTVEPMPVAVSWAASGSYVYNGSNQAPGAGYQSVDGQTHSLTVRGGGRNAGEYTARVESPDKNYTFTNPECPYEILKKNVTLVWQDNVNLVYNGKTQHPAAVGVNGAVSGEEPSVLNAVSYTGGGRTVGSYTVSATLAHTNYALAAGEPSATKEFSVAAREYSVRVYSATKTYDGKKFDAYAVNFSGLADGDSPASVARVEYSCATDLTGAGTHEILPNVTTVNENYRLSSAENGTVTIAKRPAILTADNKSKTYDGTAFEDFTYSVTNLAEGESKESVCGTVTFTVSGNATDAGTYTVTLSQANASENYAFTLRQGTLTVAKRTFGVHWAEKRTFAYGEDLYPLTATPDYPVAISYEYFTAAGVRLDKMPTAVGSYMVRAKYNTDNYALVSDRDCPFTIVKRAVTLVWSEKTLFTEGEDAGELKATADYAVEITYEYYDEFGNRMSGVPTKAGKYTVRAVVKDADECYTVTGDRRAFTIAERSDISVGDRDVPTNGEEARA